MLLPALTPLYPFEPTIYLSMFPLGFRVQAPCTLPAKNYMNIVIFGTQRVLGRSISSRSVFRARAVRIRAVFARYR